MLWVLQVFYHLNYTHCVELPASEPCGKVLIQIDLVVWKLELLLRRREVTSSDSVRSIVQPLYACPRTATEIQDFGSGRNILSE